MPGCMLLRLGGVVSDVVFAGMIRKAKFVVVKADAEIILSDCRKGVDLKGDGE
jgi:hypothetical protein